MSGCQPINKDTCGCACHLLGNYKFDNCCKCIPLYKNKIAEYKFTFPNVNIPDFVLNQVSDLNEEVRQISDWMMDKQEKIKFLDQQLDECRGEIGELKSKKAQADLVASHYIKVNDRLDKLESENKMRQDTIACVDRAYDEECEKLEKRIITLEERGSYQSDVNAKISRSVDEIAEPFSDFDERITYLEKLESESRLMKLESTKLTQELDPKVWVFMKEQIDKLEQSILETRIQFIDQLGNDKKPYKCPVCLGEGRVKLDEPLKKDNTTYFSINCISCKEQGIVWG